MRAALLLLALCMLANCGIKRPIMPPKDVPIYEERIRKKRERLEGNAPADTNPEPVHSELPNNGSF